MVVLDGTPHDDAALRLAVEQLERDGWTVLCVVVPEGRASAEPVLPSPDPAYYAEQIARRSRARRVASFMWVGDQFYYQTV